MKKTAFLFPGQGAQSVGMGHDFFQEFDFVREIFDMASDISKTNISKLCFNGPMEDLTLTVNLQPSITAVSLACLAAVEKEGVQPDVCAGHSLGEYSALCSASIISKEDALRLVFKRGEFMHRESTKVEGAMSAILGLTIDAVQALVDEVQKDRGVSVANHNTATQIVITGVPEQVQKVSSLAVSQGAKAIPLKVSGAWHSELMKGAEKDFSDIVRTIDFKKPEKPVIHNVTADVEKDPKSIKEIMVKQLCSPVKWYDSIKRLVDEGVEVFAEIGPGAVLAGILKKNLSPDYPHKIYNINGLKAFENFLRNIA
ncbi:MAG: ACP S-malonyltransferase [Deltaproteobacteria bacterium]|nr:ACP S-malonyltransferase [Deltaproteobacteria bacterium]